MDVCDCMVSRRRELKRIETSSNFGFGRMGLPSSHPRGRSAYTPLYDRSRFKRFDLYEIDPLSSIKASSLFIVRVFNSGRLTLRRFVAALSFEGARAGYVFKMGAEGLGYYRDD